MTEIKLSHGDIVTSAMEFCGVTRGMKGVIYDIYFINGRLGFGIIFENGVYDGFSVKDLARFGIKPTGSIDPEPYEFSNVIQLTRDFEAGRFNPLFVTIH